MPTCTPTSGWCASNAGDIGTALGTIQKVHPETSIGSYPHFDGQRFSTELIVRAREQAIVDAAAADVEAMIAALRSEKDAAAKRDLGTGEVA